MLRNNGTERNYNDPDVIEERNKRLAVWLSRVLDGADSEKIRHICKELNLVTNDVASQKLIEYLHESLRDVRPALSRADILKRVTSCHEEAFGWLQHTYYDVRD
jgi:hypothetical protein